MQFSSRMGQRWGAESTFTKVPRRPKRVGVITANEVQGPGTSEVDQEKKRKEVLRV